MFDYPPADDDLLEQIRDRILRTDVAHLITVGPEGYPRARAMEDHNVGPEFVFHFATSVATRKVSEIDANPRVAVAYYEPATRDYVCVFGRAEVDTEDAARAELWRPEWAEYWAGGPLDPDYAVIHIVGEAIEYFDIGTQELKMVTIPR